MRHWRRDTKESEMISLEFSVPVPTALCILTLALIAIGFVRTQHTQGQMLWLLLGFIEVLLTLICFVFTPYVLYYTGTHSFLEVINPIVYSVMSLFLALGAGMLILKGTR